MSDTKVKAKIKVEDKGRNDKAKIGEAKIKATPVKPKLGTAHQGGLLTKKITAKVRLKKKP